MAVHGRDTPFYSSILKAVEKYIPEYKEPGTPDMTRFSTRHALSNKQRMQDLSIYDLQNLPLRIVLEHLISTGEDIYPMLQRWHVKKLAC